jgi:hypothetical protein
MNVSNAFHDLPSIVSELGFVLDFPLVDVQLFFKLLSFVAEFNEHCDFIVLLGIIKKINDIWMFKLRLDYALFTSLRQLVLTKQFIFQDLFLHNQL